MKNLSREDIIEDMYFVKLCFRSEVKYQILAKNIEDLNHKVNVVALIIKANLEENDFASIYFEKEESEYEDDKIVIKDRLSNIVLSISYALHEDYEEPLLFKLF